MYQIAFTLNDTNYEPQDVALTYVQVIVALATLQSSVQDLSRAYINHANTVLNPGRTGGLDVGLSNILADSGLLTSGRIADVLPQNTEEPMVEGKKKRKRAKHDPNAPKRALTPYFLYMQSARSQIAKELGEHAKPKEVADEGTRRWGSMSPGEKAVSSSVSKPPSPTDSLQVWDEVYASNLAVYRVKMAAYKAGQPIPDDAEAQRLVEMGKAPAAHEIEAEADDDEEEEEEEPEPVKAPEPPKSAKRRKSEKTAPEPAVVAPVVTPPSPEKKKPAKKGKKEETAAPAPTPAPAPVAAKPASEKKKTKAKKVTA